MVIVKGPLFSVEASGMLADAIIYQHQYGKDTVRGMTFPPYVKTSEQEVIRDTFSGSVDIWINLHTEKQDAWKAYEDSKHLTGYKAFMNQFLRRTWLGVWQFELPPDIGFCVTGNHNVGEFTTGGGFVDPDA